MFIFQNELLKVRTLRDSDKHNLVKWLSNPIVLEYYEGRDNPHDLDKVMENFYVQDDAESRCIIEYEGQEIGYVQFYEVENQTKIEYGYDENEVIYGTDQFIGESTYWNRGIGKLFVAAMIEYLINIMGAHKIIMDPQTWNERAIRCYESCGFQKIKLLPKHEIHEGEARDCWLIEYRKK
ncbi:GNAT family N-acetyltransferase [Brevibacillus daliensis]|uniref:GNAT family N-acetyltransferase n=1 Tax=Brevibacillus daliensis TaxID=2892995 RepID=UPI001E3F557E|nr:GNAT family N-acetyltransferase [Brevibacillus daliensis]